MSPNFIFGMAEATLVLILASATAQGAEKHRRLCGTVDTRIDVALEVHERGVRLRRKLAEPRASRVERAGNLAIIDAAPSIVLPPNRVDLQGMTLRFSTNGGSSYAVSRERSTLDRTIGRTYNFGDDDTRTIDLSFPFTYYGRRREVVHVNSNGNITFGQSDFDYLSSNNDMLDEPARIAPFFADLDPSAGGTVRIASQPDRLVVTWERVPEWSTRNENTFQVELRDDSDIVMRFGDRLDARAAVVGLGSGTRAGARIVDLSQTTTVSAGALFERFFPDPVVDTVETVRRFYQEFSDIYDTVILWTNFRSDLDDAFAYHVLVRNDVQGIGKEIRNRGGAWGSRGKLQSFVLMGDLNRYPDDPHAPIQRDWVNALALLAHEVGHRWLAFARILDGGAPSSALLGRQDSHWSFFLDSSASFLEGNDFEEESPGRFRSVAVHSAYSRLDLYLMGLASAGEVSPFTVIADGSGTDDYGQALTNESYPSRGAVVRGTGKRVLIDDVIGAEGPRVPNVDQSPKRFRHAFILLAEGGNPPSGATLSKLDAIRTAWEGYFQAKTLGRATADATLE